MSIPHCIHDFQGETFDDWLWQRLILFDQFEKVSSWAVFGYCPHMIFGLHVLIKFDDVRMVQLFQDFGFIDYFSLPSFIHSFDSHKLELFLSAGLKDDRVLSFSLFLINMVFVHCSNQL